jgi:hypothetical protein
MKHHMHRHASSHGPVRIRRYSGHIICCLSIFLLAPSQGYAVLVLNHIHHVSGSNLSLLPNPAPSQIFPDAPLSNSLVIEDFTVTGADLRITRVSGLFRALAGFTSFQDVINYKIIFDNSGTVSPTLAGNVANLTISPGVGVTVTQLLDGTTAYQYGRVDIDLDVLLPSAGQYWIGIAPIADSQKQFFLMSATPPISGGQNARFVNPGEGFLQGPVVNLGHDAAYAVTAVPEPGALPLWLMGAACCLSKRSRRPSGRDF